MSNKFLSKSLYVRGIQCPKSLWLKKYKPDVLEQNTDPAIFELETYWESSPVSYLAAVKG